MKRYSHLLAGASWMAEYGACYTPHTHSFTRTHYTGNPDTEEWSFLRRHSAYQLLRHDCLGLPEGGRTEAARHDGWKCPKVRVYVCCVRVSV